MQNEINRSENSNFAVRIRNLEKSYNGNPVLDKICMHVEKGKIYGLLGSSGCGKTTLLSCILGLQKWNRGQVFVFGTPVTKHGSGLNRHTFRVGYMPQDLALHEQLTPREIVALYGKLYGMSKWDIEEKSKMLFKLLNISQQKSRLISNLSGGQKRRVSLAMTLIHTPDLLILDEPTVGVDPLLRQSIWTHLKKLSLVQNVSIVVTTHYVEELRESHKVGIMRKGRLVAEHNPSFLTMHHAIPLLQDVVLKICQQDEQGEKNNDNFFIQSENFSIKSNDGGHHTYKNIMKFLNTNGDVRKASLTDVVWYNDKNINCNSPYNKTLSGSNNRESVYKRFANWWRETMTFAYYLGLCVTRNKILMPLLVLIPMLQIIITLSVIGTEPKNLPLAVINKELPNWSKDCDWNGTTDVCNLDQLSCNYLYLISSTNLLNLIEYNSTTEAKQATAMGKSWGYLQIPENFSKSMAERVVERQFADNATLYNTMFQLQLDMSGFVTSFYMLQLMRESYLTFVSTLTSNCSYDLTLLEYPAKYRTPVFGIPNFSNEITALVILLIVMELSAILTPLTLLNEYEKGSLKRAQVCGVQIAQLMLSNGIICGIIVFVMSVVCLVFAMICFNVEMVGSLFSLYLGINFVTTLCGVALGTFSAVVFKDSKVCIVLIAMYYPVASIVMGTIRPRAVIPIVYRIISYFVPLVAMGEAYLSTFNRKVDITHFTIYPSVMLTLGWGLVLIIMCNLLKHRLQ